MNIQWFPGHMKKTLEEMQKNIKNVDVILYVLDSRAVFSCLNPSIDEIANHKPIIYVLNKIDLANEAETKKWKQYFEDKNCFVICTNSATGNIKKEVISKIKSALAEKIAKNQQKGLNIIYRAMVVGVPNSGKSSLVNALLGKYRAITGDKPGVTKSKLWVKISDGIELLDTPGTLWPNLKNQITAENLALVGCIKEQILDEEALCCILISRLKQICPNKLKERYGLEELQDSNYDVLCDIAKKRGNILKGGELDTSKTAKIVLDDFKKTRIGKISLDDKDKIFDEKK